MPLRRLSTLTRDGARITFAVIPAIVVAALLGAAVPARAGPVDDPPPLVTYVEPVVGVVVDAFRPPAHPYGPGNRGWEYATVPGPAVAPAAGVVRFAGPVAGVGVVTILHADGLRTSLTGLSSVLVRAGTTVAAGQPVGTVATRLHLGVRDPGGAYLDPALLFGRLVRRARLVAGGDDGTGGAAGPPRASPRIVPVIGLGAAVARQVALALARAAP